MNSKVVASRRVSGCLVHMQYNCLFDDIAHYLLSLLLLLLYKKLLLYSLVEDGLVQYQFKLYVLIINNIIINIIIINFF